MTPTAFYRPYFKKVIWDYDIKNLNLDKDKNLLKWFLERKITYDGLQGIKKTDLKKYYRQLNIDPCYKKLLDFYFHGKN